VHLKVLGPITAVGPKGELVPSGRQMEALLALLASRVPHDARSAWLVDVIWDGEPRSDAALRVLVLRLRRALAEVGLGECIVTTAHGYRLAIDPSSIDATEFDSFIGATRQARALGEPARAVELAQAAAALWRGDPFGEVADLPPLRPLADRLVDLRLDGLGHHGAALIEQGDLAAATALLVPLVVQHPLRERFAVLSAVALGGLGRTPEALRLCAESRSNLARELGIRPSAEMSEVEAELLQPGARPGAIVRVVRGDLPPVSAQPVAAVPALLARTLADPLIGRDDDLARLLACGVVPAPGARRAIVLVGEPGVGKTRLAAEAADRSVADGATVVYTTCTEHGGAGEEPVIELLHQLRHLVPDVIARELLVVQADPEPVDPDLAAGATLQRARLRSVVQQAVEAAGRRRLLVVVDDVQWISGTEAWLFGQLALAGIGGVSWLFVSCSAEPDGPGRDLLHALGRADQPIVSVGALDDDTISAITHRVLAPLPPSGVLASLVVAQSGGNPLYARELACYLRDGGDPSGTPPDLRTLVRGTLARLGPDARRLAQLLALGGKCCPLEAVAAAAGLGSLAASEQVDAMVGAGLLVPDEGADRFAFRHPVVARAVVDDIGPALRPRLHAALGRALDAADPSAAVARAEHLLAAQSVVELGTVHESMHTALRRLLVRGWYEEAATLGRRYLSELSRSPDVSAEELTARLTAATALLAVGDTVAGGALLDEAAGAAHALGHPELLADAVLARGPLGARHLPVEEIDGMVELAGRLAINDVSRRVQLLCWAAHHHLIAGEGLAASALVDDASDLLGEQPAIALEALVLGIRYQIAAGPASTPAAAAHAYRAIERCAAGTDYLPVSVMADLFGLTQALRLKGLPAFRISIERLRAGVRRVPRPDLVWWADAASAAAAIAGGDFVAARGLVDVAAEVGERLGVAHAGHVSLLHHLLLQRDLGTLAGLASHLRPAGARRPLAWLVYALACADAGDVEGAAEAVECAGRPTLAGAGEEWPQVAMIGAEVCGVVGEEAWAGMLAGELTPHQGTALALHGLAYLGAVDGHLGRLAAARGDLDAAVALLERGAELDRSWGALRWAARDHLAAAKACRCRGALGDAQRSDEHLRVASTLAPDLAGRAEGRASGV